MVIKPDPYVPIYFTDNQIQVSSSFSLEKIINGITQEFYDKVTIETRKIYETQPSFVDGPHAFGDFKKVIITGKTDIEAYVYCWVEKDGPEVELVDPEPVVITYDEEERLRELLRHL